MQNKERTMSQNVVLKPHGSIAEIRLNRPEAYNAFDYDMIQNLSDHLSRVAADTSVRGVVLSGEGKAFCTGGDLRWATGFELGPPAAFNLLAARLNQAIIEIRRLAKPVVAAVHGLAAGGGFSLMLACDFRVMAESATLRQAYTSNGLCLDGGGSFMLPRLVGLARSLEIASLDEPIGAQKALEWGLVTRLVRAEQTLDDALSLAERIASGSLNSFGHAKQLLTSSFDTAFEVQLERERAALASCAAHPEGQEGMAAFLEKRKPVFNRSE